LPIGQRQAAADRESRPHDERCGNDVAAIRTVGEPRNRNPKGDIEESEWYARQESRSGIRECELQAYRLEDGGDDVARADVDGVDGAHHDQDVPALQRDRCVGSSWCNRVGIQRIDRNSGNMLMVSSMQQGSP
jgi:hypothetical protein